jgi:hypothetical protein
MDQTVVTETACSACWAKEDFLEGNHDDWDAKSSYSVMFIGGILHEEPFQLLPETNVCKMRCKWGWVSSWAPTPNDQRCISANCKTVDTEPDICTSCFNEADLSDWEKWQGKDVYPKEWLEGRVVNDPWKLVSTQCLLNCDTGFRFNSIVNYKPISNVFYWKCLYNNCKDFQDLREKSVAYSTKTCT